MTIDSKNILYYSHFVGSDVYERLYYVKATKKSEADRLVGCGGWLILDLGKIHACTVGFCKNLRHP